MSELFASLPYIGDLYYRHIYLFYEEPQIFSCMTKTMQPYFVIAVPAKNDDSSAWLAVPISLGRLLKAEKNSIEIRDLITNPESFLWKIELENDIFDVATIDPKTLTDDFLPEYGELLDFKAGMEVLPPIDTPAVQATQEMRDIIEISLEKDDTHITEIPCAVLGDMLNNAGDDKPAEVVCSRFMKLNADHIRFVLKCFAENSSPIRNMKQYLLASLYNAPTTMQLSYQNQTNHDLANRR